MDKELYECAMRELGYLFAQEHEELLNDPQLFLEYFMAENSMNDSAEDQTLAWQGAIVYLAGIKGSR